MVIDTLATIVVSSYMGVAGDYSALYRGVIEPEFHYSQWDNHPYWQDDKFHSGSICYDGNLYTQVQLRFDVLRNLVIVLSPKSKLPIVVDAKRISFFTMEGLHFTPFNDTFVATEYDGHSLKLLHRRVKAQTGEHAVGTRMINTMSDKESFYLLMPNGEIRRVSSIRQLCRAFPAHTKAMRHFCKINRLGMERSEFIPHMIACAEELDRLLSPTTEAVQWPMQANTPSYSAAVSPVVPAEVYSEIEPVTDVLALRAYSPGSALSLDYGEEDEITSTPGIGELSALRESRTLEEVEVTGFRQKIAQEQNGMEAFRPALLRNVPQVMGESDILKLAMTLPGVTSTGEAASGLNVRGGATEQNLLLYNGNTIYNPMHLFGLFSAFNSDLIAESELYKGGIPSQYGGRLSSVLNIKGRIPDMKDFNGSVSMGATTAKAMAEIPLVKERVSLLLGGRSTYSDWILKKLPQKSGYRNGTAGFWDTGGTLHAKLNDHHLLDLNGYYSHDRFSFNDYNSYQYANTNISAELNSHFNERLSTEAVIAYDQYRYANKDIEFPDMAARLSFQLNQVSAKGMINYLINDAHRLNAGLNVQFYHLMPGSYQPVGQSSIVGRELPTDKGQESALWMEDSWTLNDKLKLTGGLRLNLFNGRKEKMEKFYVNPDLRLSANFTWSDNQSLKASFNTQHQYIHKVSNTVIMSPTDTWLLSQAKIKPQSGWQASAGYYLQSPNTVWEFSAEVYYKKMDNYLTYRDAAQLVMNETIEKDVMGARGRAYGLELQIRKLTGKLNGWISYTYSRTQLQQKQPLQGTFVNGGDWFSADYDIPNDFKAVLNYKFTRRYSTSFNANYSTGRPFTEPIGAFVPEGTDVVVPVYSDRNASRMPDYFRLDWSLNIEPTHHLTAKLHWWFTLGIYNVTGRRNAYSIYYKSEFNELKGYKLSIFGAQIPFLSFNIKF